MIGNRIPAAIHNLGFEGVKSGLLMADLQLHQPLAAKSSICQRALTVMHEI